MSSSSSLVLSLFPGIGLLDRAFEDQGFCVVRGPDLLWGGDIKKFHPPARVFGGVIGGPPCQIHSTGAHLAEAGGKGRARQREDLIPEFCRVVSEAQPLWFAMECAPRSPAAEVEGYGVWTQLLHNRDFGAVQMRCRRWSFGIREGYLNLGRFIETEALHAPQKAVAVLAGGGYYPGRYRHVMTKSGPRRYPLRSSPSKRTVQEALELQGLPTDFFGTDTPFTVEGQQRMVGNGIPLTMGRAVAAAVRRAMDAGELGAGSVDGDVICRCGNCQQERRGSDEDPW